MTVRSLRINSPQLIVAGASVAAVYTVPSGRTLVLRTVVMTSIANAASSIYLGIADSSGATQNLVSSTALAAYASFWLEKWLVLNPGDVLKAYSSAATCQVTGYGSLLEGAPG